MKQNNMALILREKIKITVEKYFGLTDNAAYTIMGTSHW